MTDTSSDQGGGAEQAFLVDFIDPLFAVVIHIGLTHGIMNEQWFKDWRLPAGQEVFHALVWTLAFATVLLSWLGYHRSILTKPLKGKARFLLDVILVTLYAFLMVKFKNIDSVLGILAFIFVLFVLWDVAKVMEYPEMYPKTGRWLERYRREAVTGGWCLAFIALWALRTQLRWIGEPVTLVLVWLGTIVYRVNKRVPMWGLLKRELLREGVGRG